MLKGVVCILLWFLIDLLQASKMEASLYKVLTTNYSSLVRPVRNPSKALRVSMRVFLQQIINVDEQNQVVEINAWLKFIWYDYRLRWRPLKYDNISTVRFQGGDNKIWQPDILLYNSADDHFDSTYKSNLVVYSSGEVNWIPPGIFKISCKMDITMFPFDEQICFMQFGSWTYHGLSLDLQVDTDNEEAPSADLSTYISNGEWKLMSAPARREERFYKCCPEPYPTIKVFLHLRRRALYYTFNIVIPSLLISLMTLLAFCLPAHDMSEKIGFQTTILLSVCFFLTILSEMTPTTSEAVPLLGMFFSAVTLIVSISTTFTICVLNIRYRQLGNHEMTTLFRLVFLEFIPWILLMKRPRHRFRKGRSMEEEGGDRADCVQCAEQGGDTTSLCVSEIESDEPLMTSLHSGERLSLNRKVGEGLFVPRRVESYRKRKAERYDKCLQHFRKLLAEDSETAQWSLQLLDVYSAIVNRVRNIRTIMDKRRKRAYDKEEWKFAAMALDRLCLLVFTLLLSVCIGSIFIVSPSIELT